MKYDREREVQARLFEYAGYKRSVSAYTHAAVERTRKMDASGVRGTDLPDPAGRGGVMLAEPPKRIREKMSWCASIEDAWAECYAADKSNDREARGLAYVMERYFCLNGEKRKREENQQARGKLQSECGISSRTLYAWIEQITDSVIFHAAKRDLL